MTKSVYYKGLSKNENVYVIMVMSKWQLLHVHITMQSYNLKSNKAGKQHLYHSTQLHSTTCTTSTLYCNKMYNYGTNHSS